MTKLAILEYPDTRLRTTAKRVEVVDDAVRQLAADLLETMYAAKGIGLAATQVDVHRRVLVLDVSEERDQPLVLINPELLLTEGRGPGEEGCLSVPDIYDKVPRATRIRVRALGTDGRPFEMDAEGLLGICIQHEMDHLDGKLFVDYLSELKRQLIRRRLEKERKTRSSPGSEPRVPTSGPAGRSATSHRGAGSGSTPRAASSGATPSVATPTGATPTGATSGVPAPGVPTPGTKTRDAFPPAL